MSFGRITKLNVNINECRTRITYANKSMRLLMNNPSGFVFSSTVPISKVSPCCTECAAQGVGFLNRHFGPNGSIRKTPALCRRLAAVGLHRYAQPEPGQTEQSDSDQMSGNLQQRELHTWHLEEMVGAVPQRATKVVHPKERMRVQCMAWHLNSCKSKYSQSKEYEVPECNCERIKDTLDYLNEVMSSLPHTDGEQPLLPDMEANMIGINALAQKLNELLEEQNRVQGYFT